MLQASAVNGFDLTLLQCLNRFAHQSPLFDSAVFALSGQNLFKGVAFVVALWWIWFKPGADNVRNREIVLATVAGGVFAVCAGRLLADCLPFRLRPLETPGIGFITPYGAQADDFRRWSSFPSDHTLVFFALSTGLWFVSRRLGAVAALYTLIIIALPRIYLGFHYPTDILGGALIGMLVGTFANRAAVRRALAAAPLRWLDAHPASFYACFFVISEELSSLFAPLRSLAFAVLSLPR